jgi:hypothetical protein
MPKGRDFVASSDWIDRPFSEALLRPPTLPVVTESVGSALFAYKDVRVLSQRYDLTDEVAVAPITLVTSFSICFTVMSLGLVVSTWRIASRTCPGPFLWMLFPMPGVSTSVVKLAAMNFTIRRQM